MIPVELTELHSLVQEQVLELQREQQHTQSTVLEAFSARESASHLRVRAEEEARLTGQHAAQIASKLSTAEALARSEAEASQASLPGSEHQLKSCSPCIG